MIQAIWNEYGWWIVVLFLSAFSYWLNEAIHDIMQRITDRADTYYKIDRALSLGGVIIGVVACLILALSTAGIGR